MNAAQQPQRDDSEVLTVILQLLAIPLFLFTLWAGMNVFADAHNAVATGTVTSRQELIRFSGDEWHRAFEVSYRYSLPDSGAESGSSFVDQDVFQRLPPGASVKVHYSPWKLMRLVQGIGSFIEGTSWSSRLPGGAWQARDWGEALGVLGGMLVGWFAYRLRSGVLAVVAGLMFGAAYPIFLLLVGALFAFPFLFWAWRKRPSHGYGWMLLASLAVSTVLTYWRVPHPDPLPQGPSETATAVVRQIKQVRRIWSSGATAPNRGGSVGQKLGHPFYMIDLEFTPSGATDPIHAVDKVDESSGARLVRGQSVPIVYPLSDPRLAQVVGATRRYGQPIFRELMVPTLIGSLLITLVGIPLLSGFDRLSRKFFPFAATASMQPEAVEKLVAIAPMARLEVELQKLPQNDPRRLKVEELMRTRIPRADPEQ